MITLYLVILILRITTTLIVFKKPIPAVLIVLFLDWIDWRIAILAGISPDTYQILDKYLDSVWYVVTFIFLVKNKAKVQNFWVFVALFVWRAIGEVLFMTTGERSFLFYCPNLYEPMFWIYVLDQAFKGKVLKKKFMFWVLLFLAALIKWPVEYIMHHRELVFLDYLKENFISPT